MTDLIRAAKLWAKTSTKTGATYYVGRMGGCRVLVMENTKRDGDGEPTHWLMLGDAEQGEKFVAQPRAEASRPAKFQRSPAQHQNGTGWRGSSYRRPSQSRVLAVDDGELLDDSLDDLGRR
jgi:hypothetical protein